MSNKINNEFKLKWDQLKEENSNSTIYNSTQNSRLDTKALSLDKIDVNFDNNIRTGFELHSNEMMSAFNINNRSQLSSDSDKKQQLSEELTQQLPLICGDVTADIRENNTTDKSDPLFTQRKMPVSQLQEFCVQKGLRVPEYRVVSTEGQSHSPLFTIQAIIDGVLVSEGMAKNKKMAKHNAAEKALNQLKSRSDLITTDIKKKVITDFSRLKITDSDNCDSSVGTSAQNESQTIADRIESNDTKSDNSKVNAVSFLQEICAKNGISLPIYEQLGQLGPSHEPIFWFKCKIVTENEEISAKSSGKTKQIAKRETAKEVLKLLNQKEIVCAPKQKKTKSKIIFQNNTDFESQSDSKEMLEFLEALYDYHELDTLFESNDTDYCLRLNIIAEKIGCVADYVKLSEEQSKSNNFKCLLQLKKSNAISRRLPVFVSWGNSCTSLESAMQKAAQKAIIMIKVLKMN